MLQDTSILITDDDRGFRETLQDVFELMGFRTLLAENGEEALEIVRAEPVHLMLLDMHMPKLTGLETIRIVFRSRMLLPCILMSAQLDDAIVAQARAMNVYSVLSKPIARRELTATVLKALDEAYGNNEK